MRNLFAIMRRRMVKESAQDKISALLKEFIHTYNCYPNYQYNKEDWEKHYDIANRVIKVYDEFKVELNASKISNQVFIGNVADHIQRLENIRDHGNIW